jgi:hypothetical protein
MKPEQKNPEAFTQEIPDPSYNLYDWKVDIYNEMADEDRNDNDKN